MVSQPLIDFSRTHSLFLYNNDKLITLDTGSNIYFQNFTRSLLFIMNNGGRNVWLNHPNELFILYWTLQKFMSLGPRQTSINLKFLYAITQKSLSSRNRLYEMLKPIFYRLLGILFIIFQCLIIMAFCFYNIYKFHLILMPVMQLWIFSLSEFLMTDKPFNCQALCPFCVCVSISSKSHWKV